MVEPNEFIDEEEKIMVDDGFKPYYNSSVIESASESKTEQDQEFISVQNTNHSNPNPFGVGPIPILKIEQENKTKLNKQIEEIDKQSEKLEKERIKILNEQPIVQSDVILDIKPDNIPYTVDENKIQTVQIEIESDGIVSIQQAKYTPLTKDKQPNIQNVSPDKKWTNSIKPHHNLSVIEPASEPETEQENEKKGHIGRYNKRKKNEKSIRRDSL